jgi:hypothetical protein
LQRVAARQAARSTDGPGPYATRTFVPEGSDGCCHALVEGQEFGADALRNCDVQRIRRAKRQVKPSKKGSSSRYVCRMS